MKITQEHLAENLVKAILKPLYDEFIQDKQAHENAVSFDEWAWDCLSELGQVAYDAIGEMYTDLDTAVDEVM